MSLFDTSIIPIVISSISLALSGYTLWLTRAAPFKLKVLATGRVGVLRTPPPHFVPTISMRLLFVNEGARRGYIGNVALVISGSHTSKPQLFGAMFEDVADINFAEEQQKFTQWVEFASFPLGPGESITKRVVFRPNEATLEFFPEADDYQLILYTVEEGDHNWKRQNVETVTFSGQEVRALSPAPADMLATSPTSFATYTSKPLKHRVDLLKKLETTLAGQKSKHRYLSGLLSRISKLKRALLGNS